VGEVGGLGRRDPLGVVVDAGVEANSADDAATADGGLAGAFDEGLKGGGGVVPSEGEEPGSSCVTVDGNAAGDVVIVGDFVGTAPMEEFVLDELAVRVAADAAAALMASGVHRARFLPSSIGTPA
jgi:hypothetical protein